MNIYPEIKIMGDALPNRLCKRTFALQKPVELWV